MARIRIDLPEPFHFSTKIPIRITDLNYGGHVGNDTMLGLLHEARVQFLKSFGYDELNLGGVSLIMNEVFIQFKAELFYGDVVTAFVKAADFSHVGFDLYYQLMKERTNVVIAKTGMICYNYNARKVMRLPQTIKEKLSS